MDSWLGLNLIEWIRITRLSAIVLAAVYILFITYRRTYRWTAIGLAFWWFLVTWIPLVGYQVWDVIDPTKPALTELRFLLEFGNMMTFLALAVSIHRFDATRRDRTAKPSRQPVDMT